MKLKDIRHRMNQRVIHLIESESTAIAHLRPQIRALSPAATLERGYAIVQGESGEIIRQESQVKVDQSVLIRVSVGEFSAIRIINTK